MRLYADKNFRHDTADVLRTMGHDVLTAEADGRSTAPDTAILARAHSLGRVVLTGDRWDFHRLHRSGVDHSGIVTVTPDDDFAALATRIDAALTGRQPGRWCVRVTRS